MPTYKHNLVITLLVIYLGLLNFNCKKYLDPKPDKKLVIPTTLNDLQTILDFYPEINNVGTSAGEISSDDYYVTEQHFNNNLSNEERRMYIWEKDYVFAPSLNDWSRSYTGIYRSNTVLTAINDIIKNVTNENQWQNVKGQALYHRSKFFFQVVTIWSKIYNKSTAEIDLGIPLKLNTNFNEITTRHNVQVVYDQIINDLKEATSLLLDVQSHVMRPSKAAAYGLLARVYLAMQEYDSCLKYSTLCMDIKNSLMDFNNLPINNPFPISQFNSEVIAEDQISTPLPLAYVVAKIDSTLYNTYSNNDLRKVIYFRNNNNGTYGFRGSYENNAALFGGVATDEIYLMRAECYARIGNKDAAILDLNTLLVTRWDDGTFVDYTATDANDALVKILSERRKELLMRGLRWMDIKRLNNEGANITLRRVINGQIYTLHPNDLKYALPIPEELIPMSGMQQNPR